MIQGTTILREFKYWSTKCMISPDTNALHFPFSDL